MKRLIALTLSALLLCPMTSFAAQTEEARAVYQEMMDRETAINDMNAYFDMNVTMSGDMFKEEGMDSVSARIEMNTRMQNMTDPSQLRYHAFMRMTLLGESMEASMYYENGYYYMDMLGQKVKVAMPVDQMMQEALSASDMLGDNVDYFRDLSVRTEGENRILSYTIDGAKMTDTLKSMMGMMSSLYDGMEITMSDITGEYIINPEGYYTKAIMNMDMTMKYMEETINMTIVADIGVADPGQPVVINTPNLSEFVEQPAS